MKTVKQLLRALLIFWVMVMGGCWSGPSTSSNVDELDIAIRDASDYLNSNIPRGSKIVILNIQSTSPDLSDYVIDELIANAVNDRVFSVVDRQQLDTIRAEQDFQMSGEVDDDDALAIGRFFGAQTIVSGAVNRLGTGYRIRIRALEVQTAQVQGQYNRNIASSPMIGALEGGIPPAATTAPGSGLTISGLSAYRDRYVIAFLTRTESSALSLHASASITNTTTTATRISGNSATLKVWAVSSGRYVNYTGNDKNLTLTVAIFNKEVLIDGEGWTSYVVATGTADVSFTNGTGSGTFRAVPVQASPSGQAQPAQPSQPATPTRQAYRVGDTGPAGGLIFYDKGNNSGGWRYLEAAPVEAEIRAVMNVRDINVDNTQATIGSGRRNTQLFVEKLRQTAGEWDTAAQQVDDLVFGGFDDWFIPSRDELDQMYGNLKRRNLGDFKNEWYFSSTQYGTYYSMVHGQNFADGSMETRWKTGRYYVRPIRQVEGP